MALYHIVSIDKKNPSGDGPLYWSNTFGWVNKKSADVFTKTEHDTLYLPIGGKWVEIR
jgi:hypothetical protein